MDLLYEKIRQIVKDVLIEGYGQKGKIDDEYYTQEEDVNDILTRLRDNLNGKVVYCPCDDPEHSAFYKILKQNYNSFGLRGLYATSINGNACFYNGNKEMRLRDASPRWQDNTHLIKKCDVIATNPPFSESQPTHLIDTVMQYGKEFVIIAPKAFTQLKHIFSYVKNGKMYGMNKSVGNYIKPDGTIERVPTAIYTSYNTNKEDFITGIKYDPRKYRKFDGTNIIDCGDRNSNFNAIPDDYYGDIAVSPNGGGYLARHNPDQFEIVSDVVTLKMNGEPKRRAIIRRKR